MIPIQQVAKASAHLIASVILDTQHRRMSATFKNSEVSIDCGWSGDDVVLRVRNAKGQIGSGGVLAPKKKKIILPPGVKG